MENIEEGLLLKERELVELRWEVIWEEVKEVGYLAGPMIAVTLSMYLLEVISIMMVGHLGELSLSSTALALSLAAVTGFSFLLGMASALETLCGQAFGAKRYQRLGTQTYTAILSLFIVCIPLTVLWIYMGKLLTFIGQDPQISHEAGKFIKWLIPALFAYANLQPLIRYLQMQSMIVPMLMSSGITICFHIPLSWVLVFCTGLGNIGVAVAIGISMWLNVIILASYMRLNSACAKTCAPMSWEIVRGMREFFRFAIPSAIMICLEWRSFELLILLSGLLPNPQLETSVLSICLNTISTLYAIPFGLSGAVSTRVSNQLGVGNPQGARVSVVSVMLIAATETILVSATLFVCRNIFGYIFSNEKEVVDYVANMAPLLCLSVITDSLQGTFQINVKNGRLTNCGTIHILGEGMWLAAYWSLCQSCFILPMWNSYRCFIGFLAQFSGERLVDRHTFWCSSADYFTFCGNMLHKLENTSCNGKGEASC